MIEQASPALSRALASIVTETYVISEPAARAEYAIQGIPAGCVVAPGSAEELSQVVRVAAEQHAAVTVWGGGTQQQIGNPPARVDVLVRTERLNRVLIYEPDDLTISVEAGMTLGALREIVAQHGQMLPLDPPLPAHATIGGLLATAADGPRRLGYGTLRELTIGIGVVEASGRMTKAGGMVVKNVSGFDMMKLYGGSLGTLAIITSANFKLQPRPRAAATLLCGFSRPAAAFAALEALHLTQLTPTTAEYLNAGAMEALGQDGSCALALRAEGLPASVERHLADMTALALRHGARGTQRFDDDAAWWAQIADLPQTATLAADEALLKITALPSDTEHTIAQIEQQATQAGAGSLISARALNGVIYARLQPINAGALRAIIAALPGTQWVATALEDVPRWGTPPEGLALIKRIKAEFDPHGTLNPGRYLAGM